MSCIAVINDDMMLKFIKFYLIILKIIDLFDIKSSKYTKFNTRLYIHLNMHILYSLYILYRSLHSK